MTLVRLRSSLALIAVLASSLFCANADAGPPLRAARALPVSPGTSDNARSPLGTNLSALSDFSSEWPFADAFKTSRAWISTRDGGPWDDGRAIDVDARGWVKSLAPGQWVRTLLLWDLDARAFPAGDYTIVWRGAGVLEASGHTAVSSAPGRIVLRVDPSRGGIMLTLKATEPADPVRDIRVWMPGLAPASAEGPAPPTFHPQFLANLKGYKVLRFMDWMATNDSKQQRFDDRPRPDDARYTKGAPVEVMVELANTLKADPWFTLPHLADDDYVTRFATLVKERLDKDRVVYVEYSNEVWNGMFEQARWAQREGRRRGLSGNDFEAQLRQYAARATEVLGLFQRAFGDDARLVRVMASMAVNAWASETVLSFQDAYKSADALAIAPYLGGGLGAPESRAKTARMSVDAVMAELKGPVLEEVRGWMRAQKKVADRFGLPLIAYEGGQHLAGVGPVVDDAGINALFDAANRDARMKDLYLAYLEAWRAEGGQLFVHYLSTQRPSKWGRWGALEHQTQARGEAPKHDALQTFIAKTPAWWPSSSGAGAGTGATR